MPSGGHARSGPPPDPNALRRDRADDKGWTTLPVGGFTGDIPEWPLPSQDEFGSEFALWMKLWRKPQAFMWSRLGLEQQIASYVRSFVESTEPGASAGLKTAVLRMEGELGISIVGMNGLRWKFSEDQLEVKRTAVASVPSSARERLKALNGAG